MISDSQTPSIGCESLVSENQNPGARHSRNSGGQSVAVNNLGRLTDFSDLWDSLGSGFQSPMQSFFWSQSALESVCAGEDLQIVLYRHGDSAALAPLVRHKGVLPVMTMLGVERLGEPMDFLYTDLQALDSLADVLRPQGRPLCLEHLLAETEVISALRRAYRRRGFIRIDAMNQCPYIPLHPGWAEPETQFNAGRRSDFRRAQKRAEQLGVVTYEILAPTPAEVEPLLAEIFAVEAQGWKGRAGTDLVTDRPLGEFYRRFALRASEQGLLRLCFMRIDGKAVAVQYAVEYASRFWLLKIGYDEQYARCSAGNLLMLKTVQYAAEKGLEYYEFLGSAETWTKVWSDLVRQRVKIRVYPFNIFGALYFSSDTVKFGWKQLKFAISRARILKQVPNANKLAND